MARRKVPAMPTPPRSYSAAAAEKLRLALLALAASAAVVASAQDVPDDDPADTDVLGEIPEDIEEGGVYVCNPCEKESCASDDCLCDGPCEEGKPCTDCDTQGSAEEKTHAENAETKPHAESAEGAETKTYAENSSATNAPSREAGPVPEASASGTPEPPPPRIQTRGRIIPAPETYP